MKDPSGLYNSIINKETDINELSEEEASALFAYLCELTEQGKETDEDIFRACAERIDYSPKASAEDIIGRAYGRIGLEAAAEHKPRRIKRFLRSLSVAMLAVLTFTALFLGSTSVLGIDVVEKVRVIFAEETSASAEAEARASVIFEQTDEYGSRSEPKSYYNLKYLFANELPQYLYPSELPEELCDITVTKYHQGDAAEADRKNTEKKLFSVTLSAKDGSDDWHIFAKPASEGYLPLGYEYKTEIDGAEAVFVYTVARSNGEITRYSVYTVYDGVLYTFYMYTSDFETVKAVIESMKLP